MKNQPSEINESDASEEQLNAGLPPEPVVPQKSYRPRPKRRWGRVIAAFLIVILLASLSYVGYIGYNVAKISTKPLDLAGLGADSQGRTNILVLGVGDAGHAGEKLSDTIMVVSLDQRTKRVAQVSIPRDLRVAVPDHGYSKINAANALGGIGLASQTVSNTLDIPIHHYIQTNFSGLAGLVDAVGGLDVDVKERLVDTEYPCDDDQYKVCGLDIKPGLQHMDGKRVLQYVRCRKGTCGNDFGRAARQQEVSGLLRDKLVRTDVLFNPARLTPAASAIRQGLQTDMGAVQLLQFAKLWQDARANQPVNLVLSTSQGGYLRSAGSTSDLVPTDGDFIEIQNRVAHIFE